MYAKYRELRDAYAVTDYRVAKDTGIPYSTLRDWAKGMYQPKVDKIAKLAKYFDVSLDEFYQAEADK